MEQNDMTITTPDVLAHLSERGQLEWDLAVARAETQKLREEVARLRNEQGSPSTGSPDSSPGEVPPAGEPDPVPAS